MRNILTTKMLRPPMNLIAAHYASLAFTDALRDSGIARSINRPATRRKTRCRLYGRPYETEQIDRQRS